MAFEVNKFIKFWLLTQSEDQAKAYRVVGGGLEQEIEKSENMRRTLGGKIDVTYGGIYYMRSFVIKVYETESGITPIEENVTAGNKTYSYGSMADLQTLYKHKGRIYFKDFLQNYDNPNKKSVLTVGSLEESPASVIIKGTDALWTLQLSIMWEDQ